MLAQRAIAASPRSFAAHHQAGVALDLLGRYAEARTHFTSALDVASTLDTRAAARRSTAVSYAFENNCADAVKEETTVYKDYFAAKNFLATSEVAYQAGTICLEAGDFKLASDWFAAGRSVIRQHRDPTPVETELFRYRDAQTRARLAARRGTNQAALTYLRRIRATLQDSPERAREYSFLAGYVAFYDGNYKAALPRLESADQSDPLVLSLIAQTHEKLGNSARATEFYRKVLAVNTHDPANAAARPLAASKIASIKR